MHDIGLINVIACMWAARHLERLSSAQQPCFVGWRYARKHDIEVIKYMPMCRTVSLIDVARACVAVVVVYCQC